MMGRYGREDQVSVGYGKLRGVWAGSPSAPKALLIASMPAATTRARPRLTPIAAVLLVTAMTIPSARWGDFDMFWHLSNGRLMERDGGFPSPDVFSWSAAGRDVGLNSVLFERLFYLLWRLDGGAALAGLASLLFACALLPFALLIGRLSLKPWAEAIAIVLLAFAFVPYAGARPHMLGPVLLGALALLVERPFGLRKGLLAGVVLGCWVNLHGSFLMGFAFVGTVAAAWLYERDRQATTAAGMALLIGAAATLLSPFGFELWRMPFRVSSHPLLAHFNEDWFALRPLSVEGAVMGVLIVAAATRGVWRRSDPRALATLPLVLPAIQYQRLTILAVPLLLVAVLERLTELRPSLKIAPESKLGRTASRRAMDVMAWAILIIGGVLVVGTATPAGMGSTASRPLPVAAVDRLLACGAPAPVWNDYNWGGYLLWRGEGRYTVGMDGRAETLYPLAVFDDYFTVQDGRTGWQDILQASPAQYILVPDNGSIGLDELPGWQRVYADGIAVLGKRAGADWTCAP